MTLYEYECQSCGTVIESFQHMTDPIHVKLDCPKCGPDQPVHKIITSMNFTLKGRGWAKDGYVNTYQQTLADI